MIVGRIFAWLATVFSDDPSDIAFAVNLMSGICTSVAAMMIAWTTIMFGKLALVGRETETNVSQNLILVWDCLLVWLQLSVHLYGFRQSKVRFTLCLPCLQLWVCGLLQNIII